MMQKSLLDDRMVVQTAEGVALSAVLADPLSRAYALIVDVIILIVLFFCGALLAFFLPDVRVAQGFLLILYFVLVWGYFFICEWRFSGMTLGKKAFNLQVVGANLLPVSASQAAWRNVLRYIDFMPFGFALGLLAMLLSGNNRRIGDYMAGTVVIFRHSPVLRKNRLSVGQALAPPWRLSREEQRSLIAFAHYAEQHHVARAVELSEPFAALLPECSPEERVARLVAYGRYLQGVR